MGGAFERKVCGLLSHWWFGWETPPKGHPKGKRPNQSVFFKTAGSGGRAGFRGDLKGPEQFLFHLECKTGSKWSFENVIHRVGESGNADHTSPFQWWKQARRDVLRRVREGGENFERPIWIFLNEPRRPILLMMDTAHFNLLEDLHKRKFPHRTMTLRIPDEVEGASLTVVSALEFLHWVTPFNVKLWTMNILSTPKTPVNAGTRGPVRKKPKE
jgi:hypothetical protein